MTSLPRAPLVVPTVPVEVVHKTVAFSDGWGRTIGTNVLSECRDNTTSTNDLGSVVSLTGYDSASRAAWTMAAGPTPQSVRIADPKILNPKGTTDVGVTCNWFSGRFWCGDYAAGLAVL